MAVKHPLETFYRLIFERSIRPLVYASFPITRTRAKEQRRADIDNFRSSLHKSGAIVVDPLAIDELRMEEDDPKWLSLKSLDAYQEYQSQRWQIENPTIGAPDKYTASPFAELTDAQIKSTVTALFNHVVDRDFRLVSQCDQTIAYRPFYPEKGEGKEGPPSASSTGGVTREIDYALGLEKPVWAYHPKHDYHIDQDKNFFDDRARWGRVTRYPQKSQLKLLAEKDFSGFKDLVEDLAKLVKKAM